MKEFLSKHIVDAYLIFLLTAQASMIILALNWRPHPVQWLRSLNNIDGFTGLLAIFTGLLVLVAGLQLLAFVQSERAFLVIDNVRFYGDDPAVHGSSPLIFKIKNPGRTVATVTEQNVSSTLLPYRGELPDNTQLTRTPNDLVLLSIAPGNEITLRVIPSNPDVLTDQVVAALLRGDYTLYIYGFYKYYNGFDLFGPSKTGYCYKYVPPSQQYGLDPFDLCSKTPKSISADVRSP
jgi:hypothetical protein